jgi:hypothetical protein
MFLRIAQKNNLLYRCNKHLPQTKCSFYNVHNFRHPYVKSNVDQRPIKLLSIVDHRKTIINRSSILFKISNPKIPSIIGIGIIFLSKGYDDGSMIIHALSNDVGQTIGQTVEQTVGHHVEQQVELDKFPIQCNHQPINQTSTYHLSDDIFEFFSRFVTYTIILSIGSCIIAIIIYIILEADVLRYIIVSGFVITVLSYRQDNKIEKKN